MRIRTGYYEFERALRKLGVKLDVEFKNLNDPRLAIALAKSQLSLIQILSLPGIGRKKLEEILHLRAEMRLKKEFGVDVKIPDLFEPPPRRR